MQNIYSAQQKVVEVKSGIEILMQAIKILLIQCETKMVAFVKDGAEFRRGSLKGLASDISRVFAVMLELCRINAENANHVRLLIGQIREIAIADDAEQSLASSLALECSNMLEWVESIEATINHVEAESARHLEGLRNAAARYETVLDVSTTFELLIERIKRK